MKKKIRSEKGNTMNFKSFYSIWKMNLLILVLIGTISVENSIAGPSHYYSIANGEWETNIWSNTSNSGPTCNCDPGTNFNKVANVTNSITFSNSPKLKLSGGGIVNVNGGGKVVINADLELSGNSVINISSGDTVIVNGELKLSGNSEINVEGHFLVNGDATLTGNSIVCGTGTSFLNGTLSGSTWCGGVLPIKLVYFRVKQDENKALLTWATASEINNEYFSIERSKDGIVFEEILKLAGAGNSTSNLEYSAIDNKPLQNVSYYRLKQYDFDGKYEYSKIAVLHYNEMEPDKNLIVSSSNPNPFNNSFIVTYTLAKQEDVEVQITSSTGETVHKEKLNAKKGLNYFSFANAEDLNPGVYNFRIITGDEIYSKKIIKN